MARSGMILTPAHRRWVYASFAALFLSGVSWIASHALLETESDFGVQRSPAEVASLTVHGVSAMVFLLVLGSLIPTHLAAGWSAKRNLRTGLTMVGVNAVLILTACGLYYLGDEQLRAVASVVHQVLGVIIGVLLLLHVRWPGSVRAKAER